MEEAAEEAPGGEQHALCVRRREEVRRSASGFARRPTASRRGFVYYACTIITG